MSDTNEPKKGQRIGNILKGIGAAGSTLVAGMSGGKYGDKNALIQAMTAMAKRNEQKPDEKPTGETLGDPQTEKPQNTLGAELRQWAGGGK